MRRQEERHRNREPSPSKRVALKKKKKKKELREDALNSETIWMHSAEFPAAIRGKVVPVIDWQVFGDEGVVLGVECFLALVRQSGLSP